MNAHRYCAPISACTKAIRSSTPSAGSVDDFAEEVGGAEGARDRRDEEEAADGRRDDREVEEPDGRREDDGGKLEDGRRAASAPGSAPSPVCFIRDVVVPGRRSSARWSGWSRSRKSEASHAFRAWN